GYGELNGAMKEAMSLCAQTEGVITDPVYTGKAAAGMFQYLRLSTSNDPVLFIHTGGVPALFGYESAIEFLDTLPSVA
ncbi:MAG: hypothetical protein J3T61_07630, partial [Candidatus Brocadiales bacterium]|nr:hypothetical protein [Candidatus Bathyanammoxibius sp.]